MPDYDLTEKGRVKIILYGKVLDEKYSQLLFEKTNLTLEQVMLLDRVQKTFKLLKNNQIHLKMYS